MSSRVRALSVLNPSSPRPHEIGGLRNVLGIEYRQIPLAGQTRPYGWNVAGLFVVPRAYAILERMFVEGGFRGTNATAQPHRGRRDA